MAARSPQSVLHWILIAIGVAMAISLILNIASMHRKNFISQGADKVYADIQQPQDAGEKTW